MENAGIINSVHCTALSNDGLLVEGIRNVFQIYEFDQILVSLEINKLYQFELPLSEWLKELVSIIKLDRRGLFEKKLLFSGYDFSVIITDRSVTLNVRNIEDYRRIDAITLDSSQIPYLIDFMREFLIASYEKYGGERDRLEDVKDYMLT